MTINETPYHESLEECAARHAAEDRECKLADLRLAHECRRANEEMDQVSAEAAAKLDILRRLPWERCRKVKLLGGSFITEAWFEDDL